VGGWERRAAKTATNMGIESDVLPVADALASQGLWQAAEWVRRPRLNALPLPPTTAGLGVAPTVIRSTGWRAGKAKSEGGYYSRSPVATATRRPESSRGASECRISAEWEGGWVGFPAVCAGVGGVWMRGQSYCHLCLVWRCKAQTGERYRNRRWGFVQQAPGNMLKQKREGPKKKRNVPFPPDRHRQGNCCTA
jgi:hypothetical protein